MRQIKTAKALRDWFTEHDALGMPPDTDPLRITPLRGEAIEVAASVFDAIRGDLLSRGDIGGDRLPSNVLFALRSKYAPRTA